MRKIISPISRLRGLVQRGTPAPWVLESLELDEDGHVLEVTSWTDSPWHVVVGWSETDRELLQLAVRELPALLDAHEELVRIRARLSDPGATIEQIREEAGISPTRLAVLPS